MEERIPQRQELQDPTAAASVVSSGDETDDVDSDGKSEFEFEFPFVSRGGSLALADDLFADGRIRSLMYPVFGPGGGGGGGGGKGTEIDPVRAAAAPAAAAAGRTRGQLGRLFLEESRERNPSSSTSSSAATDDDDGDGLEGAPPESYCVWAPGGSGSSASPRPPRKSGSTGSMARWRRISDLVVGRSHSDGKEKFLFLPANPPPPKQEPNREGKLKPRPKPNPASGGKKSSTTEINTVAAAHRIAYGAKAGAGATPRRTFLPYREELVGFFANVNGISRSHPHPY